MSDWIIWLGICVIINMLIQSHENISLSLKLTWLPVSSGLKLTRMYRMQRNVNSDKNLAANKERDLTLDLEVILVIKYTSKIYLWLRMCWAREVYRHTYLGFFLHLRGRHGHIYAEAQKLRLKYHRTEIQKTSPNIRSWWPGAITRALVHHELFKCLDQGLFSLVEHRWFHRTSTADTRQKQGHFVMVSKCWQNINIFQAKKKMKVTK
jgi:hypothetical protein